MDNERMKKRGVRVKAIIFIVISIIFAIYIISNKKIEKNNFENNLMNNEHVTYNSHLYIKYDQNKINQEILENLNSSEIILRVGILTIKKIDFDFYRDEPIDFATSELIKRSIGSQEAKKLGISIREEEINKHEKNAEKAYEKNSTTISKEDYVKSYINRRIGYEENSLFRIKILDKIVDNTLKCEDEKIIGKIKDYHENVSLETFEDDVKKLDEIYNLYLIYLSKNYEITYYE